MSESISQDLNEGPTEAAGDPPATVAAPRPLSPGFDPPVVAPPGYQILGQIGQGGMGVVYHARDCSLDRPVALKFLQARFASDPSAARRFLYEAQITGQLQHPGIPAVHQVGTLPDGRPFLVMKLIQGRTLAELLREQGPGAGRWLAVFEAVCQSVGYAHSQNLIHRDLKPSNIMVGPFGEVQVMDWGLAKWLVGPVEVDPKTDETDPEATSPRRPGETPWTPAERTRAGSVLGTPAYMSPEQAIGAVDRLDRRSDVFGLGAILCALLTGKPPFVGSDGESTRQLAAQAKLDDAFARLDGCGAEPELITLAKRCLSAEQDERPADAGVVADAVAQLRRQAEDRARQAELERARVQVQANEQRKRRRLLLAASGVLIAVLLAGVVGTALGLLGADRARREEARQKEQAEKQRNEAQQARDLARQRYHLALDAFHQMVGSIQNKLETRAATQDLRKDLLENARRGLRTLLREAERQDQPDSTLVVSHLRMGDVELILGNTRTARKEYETGHQLARRLAEADPNNAEAQRDLSISFDKLGNVTLQQGESKEALVFYQKGLEICQRLAQADPKNALAQRDLSVSFDKMGDLTLQMGQTRAAGDLYQKALEVREHLAQADLNNAEAQRDLSISFDKLGNVTLQLGKTSEALDYYRKALKVRQRLAQADPNNTEAQRDLSVSFNKLGNVTLQMGKIKEALAFYQNLLEVSQRLALADPKNALAQRDLSISYHKLGDVTLQMGQTREALVYYQKFSQISQTLADADPNNAQAQRTLSISFDKLGDVTLRLRQTKEALAFYQKGLEICQRLAQADPNNTNAKRDLRNSFIKMGDVTARLGQAREALEFYQKALEISRRLAHADPNNAQAQRYVSVSFDRLGNGMLKLGKIREALDFYQQALEVSKRLALADPNNAQAQMDLFINYSKLGSAEKAQHDYARASAWFARARAVLLPWHQKKLLVGQFQNAVEHMDREMVFCKDAEQALTSLDFVFEQKPQQIGALLNVRVRALLKQNRLADATTTADRWAEWADKQQDRRDLRCYGAACALALCAAASEAKQKDVLVGRVVAVLSGLRERGYFKDPARLAHLQRGAEFAGIREHPAFRAFAQALKPR
jgi:tetratricopeptide (TPR) repeat protein